MIANSPFSNGYFQLLDFTLSLRSFDINLELTLLKTVNYGLMTIFFFVVGLEIKRELTSGHLSNIRQAVTPFIAALGGMAIPAVIYLIIAGNNAPEGWAIPVATDIALAVGLLALAGSQVSNALRAFLLALAVIDDIGAIVIIAIVYSTGVILSWSVAAGAAVVATAIIARLGITRAFIYLILGALLWFSLYQAGLHPTLAGVIMGLLIPATELPKGKKIGIDDGSVTLVEKLEEKFHNLSAYVVIPIFAFANSGIALSAESLTSLLASPIAWGIICGLSLGKPLGIFIALQIAVRLNLAQKPEGASAPTLIAVGSTAGIGFTVSIFIAKLAFSEPAQRDLAVTAVIVGSLCSGMISLALFRLIRR